MQFVLRNLHSFVHMEAPDEHGMRSARVEWAGTRNSAPGREARVAQGG